MLPFYDSAACTDDERATMLNSVYLATMECVLDGHGDNGHMTPIALTELNTLGTNAFTPRHYRRVGDNPRNLLQSGFGFVFAPYTTHGVHRTRVMVIDFSRWKVRHITHFLGKILLFNNLPNPTQNYFNQLSLPNLLLHPKILFLVGMSLICDAFSHNQLSNVGAQREESWGQHVVNREAFSQWRALGCRLGMTEEQAKNVSVLRRWMETEGPVRSIAHQERTGPGPSRVRRYDDMSGRSRADDRTNWVRGRYDRSRSGDRRGSSLNRGSSGRYQTRDDY